MVMARSLVGKDVEGRVAKDITVTKRCLNLKVIQRASPVEMATICLVVLHLQAKLDVVETLKGNLHLNLIRNQTQS